MTDAARLADRSFASRSRPRIDGDPITEAFLAIDLGLIARETAQFDVAAVRQQFDDRRSGKFSDDDVVVAAIRRITIGIQCAVEMMTGTCAAHVCRTGAVSGAASVGETVDFDLAVGLRERPGPKDVHERRFSGAVLA